MYTTDPAFAEAPSGGRVVMVRACTRSGRSRSLFIVSEEGALALHHTRRLSRGRARSRARRALGGEGGAA